MTPLHFADLLLDTALRSVWPLGGVAILMLAWRGGAAATRHFVWLAATASLLFMPWASSISPRWTTPAWADRAIQASKWAPDRAANAPPNISISAPANRVPAKERLTPPSNEPTENKAPARPFDFRVYVLALWVAGIAGIVARYIVRFCVLRKLERRCRVLADSRIQQIFRSVQSGLRLRRQIRLLESDDGVMPMTWGWLRPIVSLPADAANWEEARLELVLRHELAHIKRCDCLTQGLADFVCAIYWFNPLVWLASRQMRAERERACDDLVLTSGARPSEYAAHLLAIAAQFAGSREIGAIPIARPSGLERRLRAVVDARRAHGRLNPVKALLLTVAVAALVCCVAGWKTVIAAEPLATPARRAVKSQDVEGLQARQIAQLRKFSQSKEKQAESLAADAGERISPIFRRFFNAAIRGDGETVTNMYVDFKNRHPQYEKKTEDPTMRSLNMDTIRALEPRRIDAQVEYESDNNTLSKLESMKGNDPEMLKSAITTAYSHQLDPEFAELAAQLIAARERVAAMALNFGPNNPDMVTARTTLTNIQALYDQKLEGVLVGLQTRTDFAKKTFDTITQRQNQLLSQVRSQADPTDYSLHTSYWQPVLEICLAYYDVLAGEPKYTQAFIDGVIDSVPPGSIYFGGTDPGRGLITAFSKSHADANPFFTLSQNPLADNTYLEYLEMMYGSKLYIPTTNDSQACFDEYADDAQRRFEHDTKFPTEPKQIKPGENVEMEGGKIHVTGPAAVMAVNGLIAKVIFNKNPDREFYIEESFPLDWMYPHLEPHGIVLKVNRQPLPKITAETVQRDQDYWSALFSGMLGDWLKTNTPLRAVADFVEAVHVRKDLSSFHGDPRFIANDDAMRLFSKQRANIGDLFRWRMKHANASERERMADAARFAYAQAWAICPYSPEAVFGLVRVLRPESAKGRHDPMAEYKRLIQSIKSPGDKADALLVAETAERVATQMGQPNAQLSEIAERLRKE